MNLRYILAGLGIAGIGTGLIYAYQKGYLQLPKPPYTPPTGGGGGGGVVGGSATQTPPTVITNPAQYGLTVENYKLVKLGNGVYWCDPRSSKYVLISMNLNRFPNDVYGVYFPDVQAFLQTKTFRPYTAAKQLPKYEQATGLDFRNTISADKIAEYVYRMQGMGSNVYTFEGWWSGQSDGQAHPKFSIPLITVYQVFSVEVHGFTLQGAGFKDPKDIHIRNIKAYKDGSVVYNNRYGPDSPNTASLNVYTDRLDIEVGIPNSVWWGTENRKFRFRLSISYIPAVDKDRDLIPC